MVKVRLTYVADSNEEKIVLETLKEAFNVINVSKEYKGRGNSKYNNVYIDLEIGEKEEKQFHYLVFYGIIKKQIN